LDGLKLKRNLASPASRIAISRWRPLGPAEHRPGSRSSVRPAGMGPVSAAVKP